MKHETKVTWKEDMQFDAEFEGGKVDYDADEIVGGKGEGLRPKPTMLGALAGCTGMDVVSLLRKMRSVPESFEIEVSGVLTDDHPKIYKEVSVNYYFSGDDLKKDKIEKAVDLSVTRYCGVFEMFRSFATINHEIIYRN